MTSYITRRIGAGLLTLAIVCTLVFLVIHSVPGGYANAVLSPTASPELRQALVSKYGLDAPVAVQYVRWLSHVGSGDLGTSLGDGTPVTDLLAQWIPVTAELAGLATMFVVVIGLPTALAAGVARRRSTQGVARLVGASAMSTPDFVTGSVLVFLFSTYNLGLPVGTYVPFRQDPMANLAAMVLPAVTLGIFGLAVVIRTGRDAVGAVLGSPHIAAATARGESGWSLVVRHVLRNASIPVVTVLATYVGYLLGGAVIVESLFSLPGMGQAVLTNITGRNYPVVQGIVLVSAAAFIFLNLVADCCYGLIDPRVVRSQG